MLLLHVLWIELLCTALTCPHLPGSLNTTPTEISREELQVNSECAVRTGLVFTNFSFDCTVDVLLRWQRAKLILACRLIKQYRPSQHYYALFFYAVQFINMQEVWSASCKNIAWLLHVEEENSLLGVHYQVHLVIKAFFWKDLGYLQNEAISSVVRRNIDKNYVGPYRCL